MSRTPKIVVTGFEPFAHGAENPTLDVLAQLRSANDIAGELITVQMPVDSNRLAEITSAKLDEVQPDIWISLGLAPGAAVIAVERLAANVMDFPIPDNVGVQHGGAPVFAGGPAGRFATIPVKTITSELRAAGIPAKISNSPSTYLCNQMMYTILHLVDEKKMATRAGFIHVPAHPSFVAKQAYPHVEMPSMSIELMTQAVKKAIHVATQTSRDQTDPAFNY